MLKKLVSTAKNVKNTLNLKPIQNKRTRDTFEKEDSSDDEINIWTKFNKLTDTYNLTDFDKWISATKPKNYLLKDSLLDWLELYYNNLGFNENPSTNKKIKITQKTSNIQKENQDQTANNLQLLFDKGYEFENMVINHLTELYPNDIKTVVTDKLSYNNDTTYKYMDMGIPIIVQAELHNYSNKTFGIADLLIRSDYINDLFDEQVIDTEMETLKAEHLNGDYHYIVIDIKWTTMKLAANGKNLLNSGRLPAYKGQLAIYNAALGELQGYTPDVAYILGKAWFNNSRGTEGFNCFEKLGQIDYVNYDKLYIDKTIDAIDWLRNVRSNGHLWSCIKPPNNEMYPNMCNTYDAPYTNVKKQLAIQNNDITNIWMVGPKQRAKAFEQNVKTTIDSKCSAKLLGMTGKYAPNVDAIIKINRDSKNIVEPKIITNNDNNWQTETVYDFYIDFETISGTLYDDINILDSKAYNPFLCMIGVGYMSMEEWQYVSFVADKKNVIKHGMLYEEKRILNEFDTFIKKKCNKHNPKLYYWSNAEKSIIQTLNIRHNKKWLNNAIWCDMYKLFINACIVVKGVYSYKLKEIAKALNNNQLIYSVWPDNNINNGFTAMIEAINYYKSKNNVMQDIINYNEIDCRVVFEIVEYLRNNHI